MTKVCPRCQQEKELNSCNWHKNKSRKDGWARICKICKSHYDKLYLESAQGQAKRKSYKETHRDKYRQYRRTPEGKLKRAEENIRYYQTPTGKLKRIEANRRRRNRSKECSDDRYIKHLLRTVGIYSPPPDIIELRRSLLLLNRTEREVLNELNS